MMITEILAGVLAKIAGLGVAAKAGIGLGVATAAVTTAGMAGVVPVPGGDAGGSRPAVEVELPQVPAPSADFGLQVASDATGNDAEVDTPESAGRPETAGKPEATGIARAMQTPAADHLPEFVPGPPAEVPPANANAGTTGIARAQETPAADYLPSFVPGPPAGVPTGDDAATSRGQTGRDVASQTPAGGRPSR